jgi:hypothetical protein
VKPEYTIYRKFMNENYILPEFFLEGPRAPSEIYIGNRGYKPSASNAPSDMTNQRNQFPQCDQHFNMPEPGEL